MSYTYFIITNKSHAAKHNISNNFKGTILSRVYCKYHYLEGHETDNPEMEIWTFLVGLSKKEVDVKKKQYTEQQNEKASEFSIESE